MQHPLVLFTICSIASIQARSTRLGQSNEVIKPNPLPSVPGDFIEAYYYHYYTNGEQVMPFVRDGDATDTTSCTTVRDVPSSLRSAAAMRPHGINSYYSKYTEAYGIPIIAHHSVSNEALSRACYVLRFLLSDRADLRQAYYKNFGRVAIIPAGMGIRTLPDYQNIAEEFHSAAGVGAIPMIPVSSAKEENILCEESGTDDMLIREIALGIYHLAAKEVVPAIHQHLITAYETAVGSGWWDNTYAEHTPSSYLGEGVQSFYNVNGYNTFPDGRNGPINLRVSLRTHDGALYNLIQSLFPCANNYIKRCNSRGNEAYQILRKDCQPIPFEQRRSARRHLALF